MKFTDNSHIFLSKMSQAKKNALESIGKHAEGYAKDETPVDTGRLRNSMAYAVKGNAVYIGTNVEYGPYVEFGSVNNVAHHMIKKAATEHSDEYKNLAKRAMKNSD